MNQKLIDVHSHLQLPEYDADRAAVIARMKEAGVKTITVGIDFETSRQALALAGAYSNDLWATVGVHPINTHKPFDRVAFVALAQHPRVVAIGECGLDYYRMIHDAPVRVQELQKKIFIEQIRIAHEVKKPLMVHCRPSKGTNDAYDDLIALFMNYESCIMNPVVHFFVGSPRIAEKLLTLGCYFTFGGVITFARDYDEAIRIIPLERIMLETDAPYVAPDPYRGRRNEPLYVKEVVEKLAQLKQVKSGEVAAYTTLTANTVFGI